MARMYDSKIGKVYNFITDNMPTNHFDIKNSIHHDLKNIMAGKDEIQNQKFADLIHRIEVLAEKEISDAFIEKLANANFSGLSSLFFEENDLEIDEESFNKVAASRAVTNFKPAEAPLVKPCVEMVLTSNILLTLPKRYDTFDFENKHLLNLNEKQENWYDHPIPLDIDDASNEIIYGLSNLSESLKYETDKKVTIILSVSVTHESINLIAKEYIQSKLKAACIDNLNIYVFTEDECNKLTETIDYCDKDLRKTLGVSGRYGRHYSFLKAIVPLYQQVVDHKIKATFKIDLDQVFPQKELKDKTGKYAMENFMSYRFGATGTDINGKKIKLGMIAGSLVNSNDVDKDLFYPDVKKPNDELNFEQYFFNSQKPQYISAVGELCTQYISDDACITRVHITGGMNGILLEDLVKFRPFTPSFVTRAEDQAYLLSVINKEVEGEYLRCAHLDRFVMRHDKDVFLVNDLEEFKISKSIGDFERILIFSHYCFQILGNGDSIKKELFPFTGAFITDKLYTILLLRTLARLSLLDEKDGGKFLEYYIPRIGSLLNDIENGSLKKTYFYEQKAYDRYFDRIKQGFNDYEKRALIKIFDSAHIKTTPLL